MTNYKELICEILKDVAKKKIKNVIINIPPAHSKTFIITNFLIPYVLKHDPSCKIMYITDHHYSFSREEILKKYNLQDYQNSINIKNFNSIFTGEKADLVIFDDFIPTKSSAGEIEVAKNNIANLILNKVKKEDSNYGFIAINSRTGENDITEFLLKNYSIDYYLSLPFMEEKSKVYEYNNIIFKREAGTLLNPDYITAKHVKDWIGDYDANNDARKIFEILFQQNINY